MYKAIVLFAAMLCLTGMISAQDMVYIHHIDGASPRPDQILAGEQVMFYLGMKVQTACPLSGGMSLEVYSPDGAEKSWGIEVTYRYPIIVWFGGGDGVDTLGIRLFDYGECEYPAGYDNWFMKFAMEFPESSIGKTICIDSCYFPDAGPWLWNVDDGSTIVPQWDGPYCYTIVGCCYDYMGDANLDGRMDISDIATVVSFMFDGADLLPCEAQVDFNHDNLLDITDLTAFVEYFFMGDFPIPCP